MIAPTGRSRRRRRVLLALVLLALACAGPTRRAVGPPPVAHLRVERHAGPPLRGPAPAPLPPSSPADWLELRATLLGLGALPEDLGAPLAEQGTLVADPDRADPLRPTATLARGIRAQAVDDPGALLEELDRGAHGPSAWRDLRRAALPAGGTVVLRAAAGLPPGGPDVAAPVPSVAVQVYRAPDDHLSAALEVTAPGTRGDGEPRRELVLLEAAPVTQGASLLVLAPWPPGGPGPGAVAFLVEARLPPPPDTAAWNEHRQRVAAALDALLAERGVSAPVVDETLAGALPGLAPAGSRRGSLVFLADRTGAALARDVALEGDEARVTCLAALVAGALDEGAGEATDSARLAWLLEQSACRLLADALMAEDLPEALVGALARRAGEVGRHATLLRELALDAADLPGFEAALLTENRTFLEDSSPAARVRAYDWLARRDAAPAGYDPLASREQRRAALQQSEQQAGGADGTR